MSMGMQEAAEVLQYCLADLHTAQDAAAEAAPGVARDGPVADQTAAFAADLPALGEHTASHALRQEALGCK